ncbi:hypothetical protein EUTSA_v10029022mg [Eutrema salsugineum]|uniref:H(+)-exporting diphosphatase n=1 Tax=Eutrema salsugineum TaxID=72664 RepID=V4N167_EUTSA|nr:hypothetical protein EUTSA_v10029022mg [Eutrema salsugineum]
MWTSREGRVCRLNIFGDIAGMGSDLFGSYAESSCAALIVASISSFGINNDFTAMLCPLLIKHYFILVLYEELFLCVAVGLWAGLIIGFVTEYYTSNAYSPVQDVADLCRTGAATNVILGLPIGYKSVIITIFGIAVSIFVSFSFAAMYGIAVAALGMLGIFAIVFWFF